MLFGERAPKEERFKYDSGGALFYPAAQADIVSLRLESNQSIESIVNQAQSIVIQAETTDANLCDLRKTPLGRQQRKPRQQ
jgi:hypothetical protein